MADADVRMAVSGLERHGENGKALALPSRKKRFLQKRIGKWPVDKPEDNTADFIKPILKIKKSTISVSA